MEARHRQTLLPVLISYLITGILMILVCYIEPATLAKKAAVTYYIWSSNPARIPSHCNEGGKTTNSCFTVTV